MTEINWDEVNWDEPPDKGRLLLPYEAAAILRLDPKTLGRWSRDGLLPAIRLPSGHRRFWEADVQAVLSTYAEPVPKRRAKPGKALPVIPGQMELGEPD